MNKLLSQYYKLISPLVYGNYKIFKQEIYNKPALAKVKMGQLMTGISNIDITTPPGLGTAGRGKYGEKDLKGFKTRLKAKTILLKDSDGNTTALINMDVLSGSYFLHHALAEAIADKTDIPIENIVITATHTHSAPDNMDCHILMMGGNAQKTFNAELFKFFEAKLIEGVLSAYSNLIPAKVAAGKMEVYGVSKNRGIEAFLNNPEAQGLDYEKDPNIPFKEAINPDLTLLRVDALDSVTNTYMPLAAFSTFTVHGTTTGAAVDVVDADLLGVSQRYLEWQIKTHYKTSWKPVYVFSAGTLGDISPNLPQYGDIDKFRIPFIPLDWPAVKDLGNKLGAKAWELFQSLEGQLKSDIKIQTAARELNLQDEKNCTIDGIKICNIPAFGLGTGRGTAGDFEKMSIRARFSNTAGKLASRSNYDPEDCQGIKRKVPFPLAMPRSDFHSHTMFQLIQIGEFLLVSSPFEVTVTSGKRIIDKIQESYKKNGRPLPRICTIAAVSNGLNSYLVTPEEYLFQYYASGSTVFGKNSQPFVAAHFGKLADDMLTEGSVSDFPEKWKMEFKSRIQGFPLANTSCISKREIIQQPSFRPEITESLEKRGLIKQIKNGEKVVLDQEAYWSFSWTDMASGDIKFDESFVYLERSTNKIEWQRFKQDLQPIDDEGIDMEVRISKNCGHYNEYTTIWYNPELNYNYFYRFVILPRNKEHDILYSEAFVDPVESSSNEI